MDFGIYFYLHNILLMQTEWEINQYLLFIICLIFANEAQKRTIYKDESI